MLSPFLQKLLFVKQFKINEGEINLLGNRLVMLNASNILVLQEIDKTKMYSVSKSTGESNIKTIIEHAQVYRGLKDQTIREIIELSKRINHSEEGAIKTLQEIFNIYGLGKMIITNLDNKNKEAQTIIQNSSLALEQLKKGKSKKEVCIVTSGILAGTFTYLFNKNVDCIEIKCLAKGDEDCEFFIS
ncbi:MAG: 4-vinyl reductase [Candidatus Pacearchaeota archaeon]